MITYRNTGTRVLKGKEILAYRPHLTARFEAPLPEEKRFHSDNDQLSFLRNRKLLSRRRCPYCRSKLSMEEKDANAMNRGWGIMIINCDKCGWWCCEEINTPVGGEPDQDFREEEWRYNFLEGVLATFRVDDIAIPVQVLRDYIKRVPDVLYDLHPRKFEELVAAILKDFFDCEVSLTGQTVDGGVDIYLIRGDKTYLVQAKRRSNPGATEGVQVIRELAGVLLISGYSRGIVISTAEKYSSMAKKEASSRFLHNHGYSIELMNCRDLLNAVNSIALRDGHKPYWNELLRMPLEVSSMKYLLSTAQE